MSVGSGFPGEFLEAQVRRRLVPGAVIKLYRKMDDGRLHEKRFVVLAVDDHTVTCVINSEVSPFVRARSELNRCQVLMPTCDHEYMDHDSHIDCSRTRAFLTEEVIADLVARPDWILGDISPAMRGELAAGLKASVTLSLAEVELYCALLETGGQPLQGRKP